MSRYVLFATGPDHVQIAQCDSDVTDVRDVMVKALFSLVTAGISMQDMIPWTGQRLAAR